MNTAIKVFHGNSMRIFTSFARIAFKSNFAYRITLITGLFGSFFSLAVQIAIWVYIFRNDPAMIKYMTAYMIFSQFLRQVYENHLTWSMTEKISSGAFATDLIKPTSLVFTYWGSALGTMLANVITRGLPLFVLLSPLWLAAIQINIVKIGIVVGLCAAGYILINSIYILTGLLAFITTEANWFPRILRDTVNFFSGAIIPLAFLPGWLGLITKLLPFHLLYSFPIRFLLEDMPPSEITLNLVLLGGWLSFLLLLTWASYQRAVWRCVVQGG
jgi:ABC-2 type transport system permease protein